MTETANDLPILDEVHLKRQTMDDPDLEVEILSLFINEAERLLRQIEEHRQRGTAEMPQPVTDLPESATGAAAGRLADPLLESIADLRSNDSSRIRRALASRELSNELMPHALALLRNEEFVQDVLQAMRPAATRSAGMLVDTLLDPLQAARVRRRIPIVLGYSDSEIAVTGLLAAVRDRDQDVRYRAAQALGRIRRRSDRTRIDANRLQEALLAELDALGKTRTGSAQAAERDLELVFLLLGIGDNPDTVDLCWRALHGDDRVLKGTAIEYLENLVPGDVWRLLMPHLDLVSTSRAADKAASEDAARALHSAAEKLKKVKVTTKQTDEDSD